MSFKNLPDEIHLKYFQYLDEDSISKVGQLNQKLGLIVKDYKKPLGVIELRLKEYIQNVEMFKDLLRRTDSDISDFLVLNTMLKAKSLHSLSLHIYVRSNIACFYLMMNFFIKVEGYNFVARVPSEDSDSRFKCYTLDEMFVKKFKFLQLIWCRTEPYLLIQTNSVLSCHKCWYDGTSIETVDKDLILKKYAIFDKVISDLYDRCTRDFLQEFKSRNFRNFICIDKIPRREILDFVNFGIVSYSEFVRDTKIYFEIEDLDSVVDLVQSHM
eukprot:NODE_294_length_10530_cov_0.245326.p2 type:complete len:270 gc:universal NODE_294_length_10530_cov_0.245326:9680-8871(-)